MLPCVRYVVSGTEQRAWSCFRSRGCRNIEINVNVPYCHLPFELYYCCAYTSTSKAADYMHVDVGSTKSAIEHPQAPPVMDNPLPSSRRGVIVSNYGGRMDPHTLTINTNVLFFTLYCHEYYHYYHAELYFHDVQTDSTHLLYFGWMHSVVALVTTAPCDTIMRCT